MFSQLGPLFKTTLRQAESADTRLEIRRDDRQEQGKHQDGPAKNDEPSTLWEDSTQVSVEALRTFLTEFLKNRGEPVAETHAALSDEAALLASITPEYRPPVTNRAARAVKAYTAMSSQNTYVPPVLPEPAATDIDLADLLKADEVRTMHLLIQELDVLARRGIQTLTIEKADTFLEALVTAVRAEKARV